MDIQISMIAGFNAGMASSIIGQPFDFIKVQQQAFENQYKNSLDCFLKVYRQQGIQALFKGGSMPIMAQMVENSLLFGVIDFLKMTFKVESDISLKSMFCYFLAGAIDGLCITPFELIKIKRQVQQQKVGIPQIVKNIIKDEGFKGLFKGGSSQIIKESTGNSIFFASYYCALEYLESKNKDHDQNQKFLNSFTAGSFAGTAYWLLVYPVDTIKTMIQAQDNKIQQNLFQFTKEVIQKKGLKRLYKGITPVLFRNAPVDAVYFLSYEATKDLIFKQFYKKDDQF